MYEFAALAVGAALGLGLQRLERRRAALLLALGSILTGFLVSILSGELAESWAFFTFDTAQCLAAALCVRVLARSHPIRRRTP